MYFVYISNACTYSRDARRIRNVRATPTRDRDSGGKEEKYSLSFSPSSDIYIYIYYYTRVYRMYFVRACCSCRPLRGGEESEREDSGSARNPSDGRTIHTGRGRGQFGPVAGLDRSAKRERREESKNDRERGGALRTTLCNAVCCAR